MNLCNASVEVFFASNLPTFCQFVLHLTLADPRSPFCFRKKSYLNIVLGVPPVRAINNLPTFTTRVCSIQLTFIFFQIKQIFSAIWALADTMKVSFPCFIVWELNMVGHTTKFECSITKGRTGNCLVIQGFLLYKEHYDF